MADHEDPADTSAGETLPEDALPEDLGFEVEDARLNTALNRTDRERAGAPGAEFGHDQTYRPGYHDGGVRFGFFHDEKAPPTDKDGGKS